MKLERQMAAIRTARGAWLTAGKRLKPPVVVHVKEGLDAAEATLAWLAKHEHTIKRIIAEQTQDIDADTRPR